MDVNPQELKKTTLANVPSGKEFRVVRGDVISNVRDLANCIEHLSAEEFKHHVSVEGPKNHFADWVLHVLKNPLLAHDLNYPVNLNNQQHLVKTIRDHVKWLESI